MYLVESIGMYINRRQRHIKYTLNILNMLCATVLWDTAFKIFSFDMQLAVKSPITKFEIGYRYISVV